MDTNAVLDKVAKGIEAAEPKVEEAIRKTLGEDAAKKFHDIAEKAEKALEDVSLLQKGGGMEGQGATAAEGARIRATRKGGITAPSRPRPARLWPAAASNAHITVRCIHRGAQQGLVAAAVGTNAPLVLAASCPSFNQRLFAPRPHRVAPHPAPHPSH